MRPSRIRTLQLVAAGALAVLAVRPIGPIERGLDWLVLPARAMGELAGPLGWLQSRPMLASEGEFEGLRAAENAEQARLEAAVLRMAEPESPVLLRALSERSIRGMRAEVVERADGDLDRILIRVEDPSALHEDLPVIVGDVYIGHIDLAGTREDARLPANLFYVHLVTATEFRIGAAVTVDGEHGLRQGAARMVVGGLSALPGTRLEVHNPSVHDLEQGRVVVYEPDHAEGRGDLANGFVLGDLVREEVRPGEHTARLLGLVPRLDYATGLHEVQVLLPSAAPPSESALQVPLEEDGRWAPVRL
ncbi:MAG: hypothetical protein O2816_18700, partial [Planctomycetota bacterium]|nr:hypothetical protein [Planctomycetota bacterium]